MPKLITSHDVLEPLKQVLLASRDVIISGQKFGSKLQRFFTLGDGCWLPTLPPTRKFQTAKSTHHPHKIDDQHRECKTRGGAYFAFFLGSDNSHTPPPPKKTPDEEDLLWGWCVVGGPLEIFTLV